MLNFYTLFELAQIKAIKNAIEPNLESIYRMRCRQYSVMFNTPLHIVENDLDPLKVLEALYEEQYPPSIVEQELEDLYEMLQKIKDPEYSSMTAEETEDMVDALLNHEIKRKTKNKAPTQKSIEAEIKEAVVKPKSGGMKFDDLEKLDSLSEQNTSGFKD